MYEESAIPVLIAGAGPAGLVAALTLRKNGIPVRIIEKEETVRNIGQRGAGIMPRSQELYKILGILDDIRAKALRIVPMRMYRLPDGVEPITTFAIDPAVPTTPSRPFSNALMLGQNHSEAILRSHLRRLNCEVEFGTTLFRFEPGRNQVLAHVVKKDGGHESVETIRCRWLIGADGARGVVRKQLGLTFDGETLGATHHLVIGDVQIKGLDRKHWHTWGDLSTLLVMLRATEDDDIFFLFIGGQIDHAKIVAERAELERVLKLGTGNSNIELGRVRFISEYRPHVRMAETFRKGRVFVAGDAAHVHSPFGGQGLNSSIQDSINLSWKLSLVEKGYAAPSLLDTYTEERAPVIAEMLKKSTKLFDEAQRVKADGTNVEQAWHRGSELHMLGVNCRWSSIVLDERTPKESIPVDPYGVTRIDPKDSLLRAGERAPDAPGLQVVGAGDSDGQETTSLLDIFGSSYHTALIFSDGTERAKEMISALKHYPADLVLTVLIHSNAAAAGLSDCTEAHLSVIDREGHAHDGYQVGQGEFMTFIVRPDGVVGGVVRRVQGAKRYFDNLLGAVEVMAHL